MTVQKLRADSSLLYQCIDTKVSNSWLQAFLYQLCAEFDVFLSLQSDIKTVYNEKDYQESNQLWNAGRDPFYKQKNIHPANIYQDIVSFYGKEVMDERNMRKCCQLCQHRSGWPSIVTEKLKAQINKCIQQNWHFTLNELGENFVVNAIMFIAAWCCDCPFEFQKTCNQWGPCVCLKFTNNIVCLLLWIFFSGMPQMTE